MAYVRFFVTTWNHAWTTGDYDALARTQDHRCRECRANVAEVKAMSRHERVIDVKPIYVAALEERWAVRSGYVFRLTYNGVQRRLIDGKGRTVKRFSPNWNVIDLLLVWGPHGWKLRHAYTVKKEHRDPRN